MIVDQSQWGHIKVTGADRIRFVQGMCTANIETLAPGSFTRACMLDARGRLRNQSAIDMLQPDDVVVVDLFGKRESGTFVGDKLAYYVWKTTGTGMVIDGSMFYLSNIEKTGMPAFYRSTHPSSRAATSSQSSGWTRG